ncbi:MAG: valine--tRNA ligase, partial [Clostridia bacterium]|nr:valine--tRNA ligase [Clostridia bacterium]
PAHDPNDYEVGKRHNLEIINVINDDGTMNANAGIYEGMDRYECRKKLIEDLKEQGILLSIEPHNHNVGTHDRCHEVVEPLVKEQWFVAMESLAKPALEKYYSGELRFVPDKYGKTYTNWLEGIRDWCISRQLWWGHRIPAYYCKDCGEMVVSLEAPDKCPKCGCEVMNQDEDVLDTWFSSALWPFSTLGWPEKTPEMDYYYPTNVLVTGYDIIFFWVVRMVFSALHNTDSLPFKDVLIHGLVRDSQGRKMSKSLGNGVDPLEVIKEYGTDALRFALISGVAAGSDMRYSTEKVENARNFANKVWNATRFIMMNIGDTDLSKYNFKDLKLETSDKWILNKMNKLINTVTTNIENYDLGVALDNIVDFMWSEYCDWYIEMCKSRFKEEGDSKIAALWTLNEVLKTSMKLLHPFMPFITEEIYSTIQDEDESIMISAWPKQNDAYNFENEEQSIEDLKVVVKAVRNIRTEKNIAPSKKISIKFIPSNDEFKDVFEKEETIFKILVNAENYNVVAALDENEETLNAITNAGTVAILADGLIDKKAELEKLEKEKKRLEGEVALVTKKLSNEGFVAKAPANVIEGEKEKKAKYEELLNKVLEEIKKMQ